MTDETTPLTLRQRPHTHLERIAPTPARRKIVVGLGAPRSGLSLLSQVLQFLGVDMVEAGGDDASCEADAWQRAELNSSMDGVLSELELPEGSARSMLPPSPRWWREPRIQALKEQLRSRLEERLAARRGLWGFADARICRLLPLWREIFEELDVEPMFVWAVRPPAAAEASDQPSAEDILVWLAHTYDVLRYAASDRPLILRFDDWFVDRRATMRRLAEAFRLDMEIGEAELRETEMRVFGAEVKEAPPVHPTGGPGLIAGSICENLPDDLGGAEAGIWTAAYTHTLEVVFQAVTPFIDVDGSTPGRGGSQATALGARCALLEDYAEALVAENAALEERLRERPVERFERPPAADLVPRTALDEQAALATRETAEKDRQIEELTLICDTYLARIHALRQMQVAS